MFYIFRSAQIDSRFETAPFCRLPTGSHRRLYTAHTHTIYKLTDCDVVKLWCVKWRRQRRQMSPDNELSPCENHEFTEYTETANGAVCRELVVCAFAAIFPNF